MIDTTIRFYKKDARGRFEEAFRETTLLSQLGGVCPAVGDRIVHEDVEQMAQDCNGLENVRIYEVTARYFKAHGDENQIAVIVEERRPAENEITLL